MGQNSSIKIATKYKLALFALAILGFFLIFLSTRRYGAGLSPDSVGYISAARNLIKGTGANSFDGNPLIAQPPLFPIILTLAGGLFKIDPLHLANIVNALLYALIVFFGGLLNYKYLSSFPTYALLGSVAFLASIPLFLVSTMAWSEPLFILWVILSLLFANFYIEKNDAISLLFLALSVTLSTLTRYIGVVLVLWGAFVIIFHHRDNFKNKITHLSIFTLVSVLPIGVWLVRNYTISGTLFGSRTPSSFTLFQNITYVFNALLTWYIPGFIRDHRSALLLFGIVIGLIFGLNLKGIYQNAKSRLQLITPIVVFVAFYLTFLIISSTTTAYDAIGDRFLSPIYVPLTILFLNLVQVMAEPFRGQIANKGLDFILIMSLLIWLLAYPIRNVTISALNLAQTGQGYSSKAWVESQTVRYLIQHRSLESQCAIYSNAPDAAYILADLTTKMSPAKTFYNSPEKMNDIANIESVWLQDDRNKTCLVWFDMVDRKYLFTIDELQTVVNMNLIARFNDGAIYTISQK